MAATADATHTTRPQPAPTILCGHAHLDLAWLWTPAEARREALATARSAVDILCTHPEAHFVMSQAATYDWIARDDPSLLAQIRTLIEAERWEAVGGWWAEPDLFGTSRDAIARHLEVGQAAFVDLVGRRCTVGFAPDTFGHPAWMPELLVDAGMATYVICRPGAHEAALPPAFRWRGDDGSEVAVIRPANYFGEPTTDPSGLGLYGVGNHGGGPTREHLRQAARLITSGRARHGALADWMLPGELPVVEGDLVHHARGCYSALISFKERMADVEQRLIHVGADHQSWRQLAFWQFHDVLAGTSVPEVYDEAMADLAALERRWADPPPATPTPTETFVPRQDIDEGHPIEFIETLGEPWRGWVRVVLHTVRPYVTIDMAGRRCSVRNIAQHGAGYRLTALVHVALGPGEHQIVSWSGSETAPPDTPTPPIDGLRLIVLADGSDTWGHGIERFGNETDDEHGCTVAQGPDGLVEVTGTWNLPNRVLKLCIPLRCLDPTAATLTTPADGEMPGRHFDGPIWGRVWSYDVTADDLRITLRRSPAYALHQPMTERPGVSYRYTDIGTVTTRLWLEPQPCRLPPRVRII